ncbi:hypothetical protein CYMTET_6552, partial [Cymbomonas tetramitiformis]
CELIGLAGTRWGCRQESERSASGGPAAVPKEGPVEAEAKLAADTGAETEVKGAREGSTMSALAARVGLVFQFPERHFLSDTILEELTFGWPRGSKNYEQRSELSRRLQRALLAVGLTEYPLDTSVDSLSGGYQRRLSLALQLVRLPPLLLLDEPLAGLDWKARAELVELLKEIKKDRAVLVVSHDIDELVPLVDGVWKMLPGGVLEEIPLDSLPLLMNNR